jgi:hypothetical protein
MEASAEVVSSTASNTTVCTTRSVVTVHWSDHPLHGDGNPAARDPMTLGRASGYTSLQPDTQIATLSSI